MDGQRAARKPERRTHRSLLSSCCCWGVWSRSLKWATLSQAHSRPSTFVHPSLSHVSTARQSDPGAFAGIAAAG